MFRIRKHTHVRRKEGTRTRPCLKSGRQAGMRQEINSRVSKNAPCFGLEHCSRLAAEAGDA